MITSLFSVKGAVQMCQKVNYATKIEALADAKFIKNQSRHFSHKASINAKTSKKLRPYYCNICQCWHLTTRKQKWKY